MDLEMRFGSIALKFDGTLWLETDGGESMEVSPEEVEKLLTDYYDGNF